MEERHGAGRFQAAAGVQRERTQKRPQVAARQPQEPMPRRSACRLNAASCRESRSLQRSALSRSGAAFAVPSPAPVSQVAKVATAKP